ncbi:type IV pilus modification PilV family protein [Legionella fallonii]|uniref:Prepilin-type N-terminal cleavage/methylation domain-containing protein n=1 Tax=Legionella fallonii LLAP-10 TaxID=1212491 RepID=A0A098G6H1_9GAMM|nr:prepilin-type N-terminal cleavage/methylation domain-containing protein [Legionella fallonii]CEG57564.1 conserved protein of unknown function [Legionella fallonii LLAP-10]
MIYQKGFSLFEVLLSLILLTTVSLGLLTQQGLTRQWLTQLELQVQASQFLDQIDESLFLGVKRFPVAPHPYHFEAQVNQQTSNLKIHWFEHSGTIIRQRNYLSAVTFSKRGMS